MIEKHDYFLRALFIGILACYSNSCSGQAPEKLSIDISKIWESTAYQQVGCLEMSPDATQLLIHDAGNGQLSLVDLSTGNVVFQVRSANCSACFARDGMSICVAEFGNNKKSRTRLLDTKTGDVISTVDTQSLKGSVRRNLADGETGVFFVRQSMGRIGKIDFKKKSFVNFFNPKDFSKLREKIDSTVFVRDYEINGNVLSGILGRTAFALDVDTQKILWTAGTAARNTLFLDGRGRFATDSKSTRNPCIAFDPTTGTKLNEVPLNHPRARMLRSNNSDKYIFIHDVLNASKGNVLKALEVFDLQGNSLFVEELSASKLACVSNVVSKAPSSWFSIAGADGKVEVWKVESQR